MFDRTSFPKVLGLIALTLATATPPAHAQLGLRVGQLVQGLLGPQEPNQVFNACLNRFGGEVRITDFLAEEERGCGEDEVRIQLVGPGEVEEPDCLASGEWLHSGLPASACCSGSAAPTGTCGTIFGFNSPCDSAFCEATGECSPIYACE